MRRAGDYFLQPKATRRTVRAVNTVAVSQNSNTIVGVDLDPNYVRIIEPKVPGKNTWTLVENATISESATKHEFFDGLGRSVQRVTKQSSPGQLDIVEPFGYDVYGRQAENYLPYTDETSGWFKPNALKQPGATGNARAQYITGRQYLFYQTGGLLASDTVPVGRSRFESSPANRILEQSSPGSAWRPDATNSYTSTDRTIKSAYETNVASEVLLWTYIYPTPAYPLGIVSATQSGAAVYYPPGSLTRVRSKNEDYHEVIEYKDKLGQLVLSACNVQRVR